MSEELFEDFEGDPLADPPETAPKTQRQPKSKCHRQRLPEEETFARIPRDKALALGRHKIGDAGWLILIELDWLILKSGGYNPVRLASCGLREQSNLSVMRKGRGLRALEKAGIVTVERDTQAPFRAPLVTYHWYPLKPGFDKWRETFRQV
jgi:hypothetical protein